MPTDMEIAKAIEHHRIFHVKQFTLPHDCPDADAKRFKAEIRAKYPIHGIILTNYTSPDKVNGGLLYPEGRELDEGETWVEN